LEGNRTHSNALTSSIFIEATIAKIAMPHQATAPVHLLPNQGWDPRILVCGYDLAYAGCVLPMNVFIIISERYAVIVDTLVNQATAQQLLGIARPYLDRRTLLVVNTHADFDHAWGNQLFCETNSPAPAPIIGSRAGAARLRSIEEQNQLAEMRAEQPDVYRDVHLCPPHITFGDSLTVDGGDLSLQLFATPGHTPDHCSIYIPEICVLLAGDAAESPFPSADDGGLTDLRASLRRLDALDASGVFYCHAPADSGPALIRRNIQYFDTLEQRCRAARENGAPAYPAEGEDLEALVGYTYAEALPADARVAAPESYYRPGHLAAIRSMLRYVSEGE
jgi:glyoxylase-like metal-dependent hydrolase (beta-lactamase superfamily II)